MGGADYRITAKRQSRPLQIFEVALLCRADGHFVVCELQKSRYKRYRFGNCMRLPCGVGGKVYFMAQPAVVAAGTMTPGDATKLGLKWETPSMPPVWCMRVYYELDPETGKSDFVGKERMMRLSDGISRTESLA